jgi:predicted CXXCH cytochrome family protein
MWLISLPVAATAVEVLVPLEHDSTDQDRVHLVGRTGASSVDVFMNGELAQTVAVQDSMFHALVWLPYGLAQIRVRPSSDSGAIAESAASVEMLCGPRIPRKYERLFQPYTFHGGEVRDDCLGCHAPKDSSVEDDGEWCMSCHGVIRKRFREHMDAEQQTCRGCHRIEMDLTYRSTGIYSDMNPCYLCHSDKIGEYAQNFIHGPVAGGACSVCHDPHGSCYDNSLQSPVPLLCFYCHSDLSDPGVDNPTLVVHEPFEKGQCVACHDPHSTNNRWVLTKNSQELCINCHKEEGDLSDHVHPYNVKPRRRDLYDLRLTESGQLECLSCHNPHYSEARHLLRTGHESSCLGCHPDQN